MLQRIFPEALNANLEKGLKPFYLLSGQDLLLVGEAKDAIVAAARQHEFDEKTEVTIAADTKWETLFEQAQAGGLFFRRQILILNLPENLTAAQQKPLLELLELSHPDLLFILHLPKLAKAMEKQGWFTQMEQHAVLITCQTPDIQKLPSWITHRCRAMKLQVDNEVVQFLAYSYEGNLLALKQALQLLQLHFLEQPISLPRAKEVIEESAQFTPFQWMDALLEGKIARALRILNHLQLEDIQAVLLLRIAQKELFLLLEMTRTPQFVTLSGQSLSLRQLHAEFDRLKIWQNKRPLYQQAASRLTYAKLYGLIQKLAELEKQIKREFSDSVWLGLAQFCMLFK